MTPAHHQVWNQQRGQSFQGGRLRDAKMFSGEVPLAVCITRLCFRTNVCPPPLGKPCHCPWLLIVYESVMSSIIDEIRANIFPKGLKMYRTIVLAARFQLTLFLPTSRRHCKCQHSQEQTCERAVSFKTTQPTIQHEVGDICCCAAADDVSRDAPGTQRCEPGRRHSAVSKGWLVRVYSYACFD